MLVVANASTAVALAASADPALKPNHPNHSMPVPRMTNGMCAGTWALAGEMALPAAEDERAGQRGQPRRHVHDGAAGEIEHAPLPEEAVGVPRPMRQRRVDEEREQRDEQQVGARSEPAPQRRR